MCSLTVKMCLEYFFGVLTHLGHNRCVAKKVSHPTFSNDFNNRCPIPIVFRLLVHVLLNESWFNFQSHLSVTTLNPAKTTESVAMLFVV